MSNFFKFKCVHFLGNQEGWRKARIYNLMLKSFFLRKLGDYAQTISSCKGNVNQVVPFKTSHRDEIYVHPMRDTNPRCADLLTVLTHCRQERCLSLKKETRNINFTRAVWSKNRSVFLITGNSNCILMIAINLVLW